MIPTTQQTPANCAYKRTPSAAAYLEERYGLPCAPATLTTLRSRGGGPLFHKAGSAVLYALDDLDEWAQTRLGRAVHSTSELPHLRAASDGKAA
jgi:hypothetical protein